MRPLDLGCGRCRFHGESRAPRPTASRSSSGLRSSRPLPRPPGPRSSSTARSSAGTGGRAGSSSRPAASRSPRWPPGCRRRRSPPSRLGCGGDGRSSGEPCRCRPRRCAHARARAHGGEVGAASRIGPARRGRSGPSPVPGDRGPALAICMATYEPRAELLERQLDSLGAQTDDDWVCVISDDASRPGRSGASSALTAGDPRFVVSRAPERAGAYANFARALAHGPARAPARGPLRPGRPLASRQARDPAAGRSATPNWCSATCGSTTPAGA